MTFEEFKLKNEVYRMVCDWDFDLKECDKESYFIPCWSNTGYIYWVNEEKLALYMFSSPNYMVDKIEKEDGIKLEPFGELGEYYIEFKDDLLDLIATRFKAKKQAKRPIPPHSCRNITTFLRVMQNIHPKYKQKLDDYIASNREKED